MAQSKVELFNLAISACGSDANITDPEEGSREAALLRLWYDFCLDQVIMSAPWSSTKAYAALVRLAERSTDTWSPGAPAPRWRFSYTVPSDMVTPVSLESFYDFEYAGNALHTSDPMPVLRYNARVSDPAAMDPRLYQVFMRYLAAHVCTPLKGDDSLVATNFQLAQLAVEQQRADAANMDSQAYETVPDWLAVRGYVPRSLPRFYYPLNNLSMPQL